MGYPPANFYFRVQPGNPAKMRPLTECDPWPAYATTYAHPGWPWLFDNDPATNKADISGSYPMDVVVEGQWRDFGRDLVNYAFHLEHPDGETMDLISASSFSPRPIEPNPGTFSVTVTITGVGTWILWRRAGDANGHVAEHPFYIYAT